MRTFTIIFSIIVISFIFTTSLSYSKETIDVLCLHYYALNTKNYETAYYLRSKAWRSNHSYDWFCKNWSNNKTIQILNGEELNNDGYEAVVKIRLYGEDYTSGGNIKSSYYNGKAYMVHQNGWKIDDIKVSEEADIGQSEKWNELGNDYYNQKNYKLAIECYNKALEITPQDPTIWHNKGNALYNQGDYKKATCCYERALKFDPANFNLWRDNGDTYMKLEKYDSAITCYEMALKIDSNSANLWFGKGLAFFRKGKYEEAVTCFNYATGIEPENKLYWNFKGASFLNLGKYALAVTCADNALKIDPVDETAMSILKKSYPLSESGKENTGTLDNSDETVEWKTIKNNREQDVSNKLNKIAFTKNNDIWIINDDGSGKRKLTSTGDCGNPKWSPDGDKIIYTRYSNNGDLSSKIWIIDIKSGKNSKFTNGSGEWYSSEYIYFFRADEKGNFDRYKKNLINNKEEQIDKNIGNDFGFAAIETVSDKDKLFFLSYGDGAGSFVIVKDFKGKKIITVPLKVVPHVDYRFEDYDPSKSILLFSFDTNNDRESDRMGMVNIKTEEIYSFFTTNTEKGLTGDSAHGKWTEDKNDLIVINSNHNLEKLSNFEEATINGNKCIRPTVSSLLTDSGDVYNINSVKNNKIFYTRNISGQVLYSISLNGSSSRKIISDFNSIDIW